MVFIPVDTGLFHEHAKVSIISSIRALIKDVQWLACPLLPVTEVYVCLSLYKNTVELGYNVMKGTEYFVSL
jgi:hypothetical protein